MFPQPTEDQLEQFKELQESQYDQNNSSFQPSFVNEPHTITNINVYKNEDQSDNNNAVENYNLELMRSMQNQQIVSQPIVDGPIDDNGMPIDARRVRTTNPGKRVRQKPLDSLRATGQIVPKTADEDSNQMIQSEQQIDMQKIHQP